MRFFFFLLTFTVTLLPLLFYTGKTHWNHVSQISDLFHSFMHWNYSTSARKKMVVPKGREWTEYWAKGISSMNMERVHSFYLCMLLISCFSPCSYPSRSRENEQEAFTVSSWNLCLSYGKKTRNIQLMTNNKHKSCLSKRLWNENCWVQVWRNLELWCIYSRLLHPTGISLQYETPLCWKPFCGLM